MKKSILLLFTILLTGGMFSQTNSSSLYWVMLKDKKNSPYSMEQPLQYLSEKAVLRRQNQHIPIRENDLPVNPGYIKAIKSTGAKLKSTSKWFNAVMIDADPMAIQLIRNMGFVNNIRLLPAGDPSKNSVSKFEQEQSRPFDMAPVRSMNSNYYDYGLALNQANMIGADCLHNLGYRGQGMTIAVLDAGFLDANILPAFDSLRLQNRLLGCRDFVMGDTMVFEDYPHGMNVLSCMAGNLPGRIVGTAPQASYWLLRTEDAATETIQEEINWAVAAEFADSVGADVINSSLGYSTFDNPADNHTYADMDGNTTIISKAADYAVSKGIFVTTSAGNAGGPPWYKITAPADADSVLTVGAIDSAGFVASFSSRGPTFDGRIKPNTVAKGVQAVFASPAGDITTGGGTSFSSPITAGAVACLWQAHPGKTNMELLLAIEQSASHYATPDTLSGYGIPNFCTANTLLTGILEETIGGTSISVFPDPAQSELNLCVFAPARSNGKMVVFNAVGQEILRKDIQLQAGRNQWNIDLGNNYSSGMYFVQVTFNDQQLLTRFIKN